MTFPTEPLDVLDELGQILGQWRRRYPDTTMAQVLGGDDGLAA